MMKYIVYLSTALKLMKEDELISILSAAHKNNAARNVTGMLLYSEGTFIQVLEGMPDDVDSIYEKIEKDLRHKNILKMIDKPLTERNFPEWSMGFSEINADKAAELKGYLKSADDVLSNDSSHSAISILKTFITTNNLIGNR